MRSFWTLFQAFGGVFGGLDVIWVWTALAAGGDVLKQVRTEVGEPGGGWSS